MSVGVLSMAGIGQCKIECISVNSFRFQQFETYQRRSSRRDDAFGISAGPLGCVLKQIVKIIFIPSDKNEI
jgi:hypothetical protein